jgi:hypothetical protein
MLCWAKRHGTSNKSLGRRIKINDLQNVICKLASAPMKENGTKWKTFSSHSTEVIRRRVDDLIVVDSLRTTALNFRQNFGRTME